MIVTIDGPAGTGKSTVALAVAERLGFDFLDTGAMYRAIALEALRRNANLEDARELTFVAKHCRIGFDWSRRPPGVSLNDEPVGHLLRGGDVTRATSSIAAAPAVREQMVAEQQRIGREHPKLVTEGRDQGTVGFSAGPVQVLPGRRARRASAPPCRPASCPRRNSRFPRDPQPDHRPRSPRRHPRRRPAGRSPGAVVIDTTSITQEQVVNMIVKTVEGGDTK